MLACGQTLPSDELATNRERPSVDDLYMRRNSSSVATRDEGTIQLSLGEGHDGVNEQQQADLGVTANVTDTGRVDICISQRDKNLPRGFKRALRQQKEATACQSAPPPPIPIDPPPTMNVVIQVVGSRGDVQPFVALGKTLKETYGHRVRIATHPNFRNFVTEHGLEFFNIGGDPSQLMAYMVRNPGLLPKTGSLMEGDVGKRRKEIREYIEGCWRSCVQSGDNMAYGTGNRSEEEEDAGDESLPFVADCIIANPPSFAHIHCAEKLGIPLHIIFTMPWSPTQDFPHPLANKQSNTDPQLANHMSYTLIEMLTWQGLGDIFNEFRQRLGLEVISPIWAANMLHTMKIPHTYCWSPNLIPTPKDWGSHISISGFHYLDLASDYIPPADLAEFLDNGPPPIYIGFGSIVLDDPQAMTELIFEAIRKSGQRALVSKGWGGIGSEEAVPDGVCMLGNCPHDWLFSRVSCVVHHGGAGTTAAGITAGCPTFIVPFFGDQPFWGTTVARAVGSPEPIPHKQLTAENLANAIELCLQPETRARAQKLAAKIAMEKGSDLSAQSFHRFLEVDKLRCSLCPSRVATWYVKRSKVRLSAFAACTLANEGLLHVRDVELFHPRKYDTAVSPSDPISGGATAVISTVSTILMGVAEIPMHTVNSVRATRTSSHEKKQQDSLRRHARLTKSSEATPMSYEEATSASSMPPVFSSKGSTASCSSVSLNNDGASGKLETWSAEHLKYQSDPPVSTERVQSDALSVRAKKPSNKQASGSRKNMQKIAGAGLAAPMDFTMNLAKGFENVPKLYGDDTVRNRKPITDLKSGVKEAGKGFGLGFYDGITGVVVQPTRGFQKEGARGLAKGVGKGLGGLVLKPGAAIFGIPAYSMYGARKEIQKHLGTGMQGEIVASRIAQGYQEWLQSDESERQAVVEGWKTMQRNH